jgi:transcriptional regulator with XRE-family HTH domain
MATEITTRVGEAIAARRQWLGYSQERLAELSGLELQQVRAIEEGIESPRLEVLDRLGSTLMAYPSELVALIDGSLDEV